MRLSLNHALLLTVVTTLLPISAFSVYQGLANRDYAELLVHERLVTNALAAAADQSEAINGARRVLAALARENDVVAMTARCNATLTRALQSQTAVINLVREDVAGNVRCSGLPIDRPLNYLREPWWSPGIDARRFTVSTPVMGKISKRQILVAMHPLLDASGRSVGAITAAIDIAKLEAALRRRRLSSQAVAMITDAKGRPLAVSNAENFAPVDVERSFAKAQTLVAADGRRWIFSAAPIFERQMFVVYAEPRAVLLSPVIDNLRVTLVLAVLAILLTSIAVWLGVNRLVIRWLRDIGALATKFSRGEAGFDHARFATAPREIAALGTDLHGMAVTIAERTSSLAQAAESNRLMVREVNHRVKNNLQMVISLLELQTAKEPDAAAKLVLQQTRMRMSALALIYRLNYDDAADGDRAAQGALDIDKLLSELCRQLRMTIGFDRPIALNYHGVNTQLSIDMAIPIALFVVEAVSNALRHAFPAPAEGTIDVRLTGVAGAMELSVQDDGTGFNTDMTHATIGMDLMYAFAQQLDGKLTIDSRAGSGATALLRFAG